MTAGAALLSAGFDGLLHPLSTPVHVLALTGLALAAGLHCRDATSAGGVSAALAAAFAAPLVLGLATGFAALAAGAGETSAADALLAIALLCGLAAAAGLALPLALAAPLALLSGVAIGLDTPPDAIKFSEAVAMMTGAACGSAATLGLTSYAASAAARWRHGIALRVTGSWLAAIAIMAIAVRWSGAGPGME